MFRLKFITSSRIKLAHARHLCRHYDVTIEEQGHYGVSYDEPRLDDRTKIIEESLNDASHRLRKKRASSHQKDNMPSTDYLDPDLGFSGVDCIDNETDTIFFIEDTSVIISAFSTEKEYPGVDVKYWMNDNSFSDVDNLLKLKDNRSVVVRSDIVLYLNKRLRALEGTDRRYKVFTGYSHGKIIDREIEFEPNLAFPWLDNKTFNKWFVPDGECLPISMLPIEEADNYDFRKDAFSYMLDYLERLGFIRKKSNNQVNSGQKFFSFDSMHQKPLLLVSGYPCSGKTTLGEILSRQYGYYHIEASDFMHLSCYQLHGFSGVDIGSFAHAILKADPGIVAEKIIDHLSGINDRPVVVTGFRGLNEIEVFYSLYSGAFDIEILFIEAERKVRFSRSLIRDRGDTVREYKQFIKRDKLQHDMGIKDIYKSPKAIFVENNKALDEYIEKVASLFKLKGINSPQIIGNKFSRPKKLIDSIIIALYLSDESHQKYYTTTEIAALINDQFKTSIIKTSKNNVSRHFNQSFYSYYELININGKIKYRLSQTGISFGHYLIMSHFT